MRRRLSFLQPIIGARGWQLRTPDPPLASTGVEYRWPSASVEAFHYSHGCTLPQAAPHESPCMTSETGGHGCGVYAYSTMSAALKSVHCGGSNRTDLVLGVVLLGGRIHAARCTQLDLRDDATPDVLPVLYRAQYATILALEWTVEVAPAAKFYGVPTVKRDELWDYARQYGRRLPTEIFETTDVSY